MSVLPLVERLSPGSGLWGEPGVVYLMRTPNTALLFDCGLGTGRPTSALAGGGSVRLAIDSKYTLSVVYAS